MTISVITPTYRNERELLNAVASVEAQEYKDWQHAVVHDGPNPQLRQQMRNLGYRSHGKRLFIELGRNWHGFMGGDFTLTKAGHPGTRGGRGSRGASVALAATYLVSGEYITYLDADCTYEPNHLRLAAEALETTGADFVYTQASMFLDGKAWNVVGDGTPRYGGIDGNAVVHKAELLRENNWRWGGDADWDLFGRWLAAGASYAFVAAPTVNWYHASNDLH